MRWRVHGHRDVYDSEWVRVSLDDVEIPGGARFEHHVVHFPRSSVTAVVTDDDGDRVLLLWRHRFITDSWGWEVPAGWADPGEDLAHAIAREIEEETGHRPARVRPMTVYNALSGISDMRFTAFIASGAERIGPPADLSESSRVEWVPLAEIPKLAAEGHIQDGPSLTALMFYLVIERQRLQSTSGYLVPSSYWRARGVATGVLPVSANTAKQATPSGHAQPPC